jgi:colicin import membrane protein
MIQRKGRYPGPGGMFALSLCCHLAVYLLIWWCQLLPAFHSDEEPVTYVDMVTLPVASPQAGVPTAPAPQAAPLPAPVPASPPAAMTMPKAKLPAKAQAKPLKGAGEQSAAEDERQFSERMAKLARQQAEDKRQSDVLDRLRKKSGVKPGMPGATGTQAGSDYAAYVQSRLKDAFIREVTASPVKSPMVIATITIERDGRIDYRVEKNSGDPLFDDAVARAVTVAGQSLKPPPGGVQFRQRFRFRPEGVGVR